MNDVEKTDIAIGREVFHYGKTKAKVVGIKYIPVFTIETDDGIRVSAVRSDFSTLEEMVAKKLMEPPLLPRSSVVDSTITTASLVSSAVCTKAMYSHTHAGKTGKV